ncbi:winged helix-turn-helix domain-containing protein [Actinacidiphila sp. bgisy160]|uniref:winged helix-turn-helix domain-containing protein n=1 Tax=Actinacidiphila sp. bgisy160 TaxID=3413796 RepID=UPI003D7104B7
MASKGQTLDAVWSCGFQGESGIVGTCVSYLRRKLGDTDQSLIRTVRGGAPPAESRPGHRYGFALTVPAPGAMLAFGGRAEEKRA